MDRIFTGQEENRHIVAKAKPDLPAMRTALYAGNRMEHSSQDQEDSGWRRRTDKPVIATS